MEQALHCHSYSQHLHSDVNARGCQLPAETGSEERITSREYWVLVGGAEPCCELLSVVLK